MCAYGGAGLGMETGPVFWKTRCILRGRATPWRVLCLPRTFAGRGRRLLLEPKGDLESGGRPEQTVSLGSRCCMCVLPSTIPPCGFPVEIGPHAGASSRIPAHSPCRACPGGGTLASRTSKGARCPACCQWGELWERGHHQRTSSMRERALPGGPKPVSVCECVCV